MQQDYIRRMHFVRSSIALIFTVLVAPVVSAADSDFYIGFDLGISQYPNDEELRASSGLVLSGSDLNNEDTTWGVRAGYQFNPHLALEAGYLDLGETSGTLVGGAPANPALSRFTLSTSGPTLAVVAKWPLRAWEPYLRLGVLFADTELSFHGGNGAGFLAGSSSDSTEEVFGALGVGYRFNEHWRTQVELTFLDDVSTATVGFTYRF